MKVFVLTSANGASTPEVPRPLLSVAEQPVLAHDLRWLARHGIEQAVVESRDGNVAIREFVGDGSDFGITVRHAISTEPNGSAGALRGFERDFGDGPFLVIDAGNLFDFDLDRLLDEHSRNAAVATLALYSVAGLQFATENRTRVEIDRSGRVLRFARADLEPSLDLVHAGCHVVEPSLLAHIGQEGVCSFEDDLFPLVLKHQGILVGQRVDGRVFELHTDEAVSRASLSYSGSDASSS